MKAWLEREEPVGERIQLPNGSGSITFGSSRKATLFVDDPNVSAKHCELVFEAGFWRVRDLGSEHGTRVNGAPLSYPRALFRGDIVLIGATRLRFETEEMADNPALLLAIARDPDAPEPWLVYADWLIERGDPLGERIMRANSGARLDHRPWLGPVWDSFTSGELELDWHFGFVRRATVRPVAGKMPVDWRHLASELVGLRVGGLMRTLFVDVPSMTSTGDLKLSTQLDEAQHALAELARLPSTLETVTFGYSIRQPPEPVHLVSDVLRRKLPAFRGDPVFLSGRVAALKQVWAADRLRILGVSHGLRRLTDVTRIRLADGHQLHFEAPPGIPFMTEGNPCHLTPEAGRWRLIAGKMKGEVRVNQRSDGAFWLLPGDLIEIQGAATFRFEVLS